MIDDLIVEVLGGESFLAQDLGRAHRIYPAPEGKRDRLAGLLTWGALNELLNTHRLDPPRFRLAIDGTTVPASAYCQLRTYRRMQSWEAPQPHLVAEQLRAGATLVLDAIEEMHPPIRELVCGLERHLRTGVQVNAYASWTATEGFGVHWDDHDVIVLQISGAKHWRIYGPTRPAPLYRDVAFEDEAPTEPIAELTLRAGDVLHVPRGWWHAAAASAGEPSLHLTCGLATHTGADLLMWLVDELRAEQAIRQDLPRPADQNGQRAWRKQVAELVHERLNDPALIRAYLDSRDAAYGTHGGFSLPHAVTETCPASPSIVVRLATPRAVVREVGDTVVLEAAEQRWILDRRVAPVLRMLTTGKPATLVGLAEESGIASEDLAELAGQLLQAGVLAVWER